MDHKVLLEIAEHNPDTEEIFENNLLDTYYPQRPARLEDVCLYDFVANYDRYGKDANGDRKYSKLKSLVFQTTSSLTQKRKHRKKTTTTL